MVLDSSVTLAWAYRDENSAAIMTILERVKTHGAWVPSLWKLEIANVLEMGVRRGRHDASMKKQTLADLALLPISVDSETDRQAWGATAELATKHRLSIYDAAYLELAMRRGLPLASIDRELSRAAGLEKVKVLGT